MPELMANVQVVAMVLIIISFAVGVGNVEGFIISEIMPVYAKVGCGMWDPLSHPVPTQGGMRHVGGFREQGGIGDQG